MIGKFGKADPFVVGSAEAWRNDSAATFLWLQRAYDQRDRDISLIRLDPAFVRLRGDPRSKALLRMMNMPE